VHIRGESMEEFKKIMESLYWVNIIPWAIGIFVIWKNILGK
jgi:hypothetical protein